MICPAAGVFRPKATPRRAALARLRPAHGQRRTRRLDAGRHDRLERRDHALRCEPRCELRHLCGAAHRRRDARRTARERQLIARCAGPASPGARCGAAPRAAAAAHAAREGSGQRAWLDAEDLSRLHGRRRRRRCAQRRRRTRELRRRERARRRDDVSRRRARRPGKQPAAAPASRSAERGVRRARRERAPLDGTALRQRHQPARREHEPRREPVAHFAHA